MGDPKHKIRLEILSSLHASGMLSKAIKHIEAHIITSLYHNNERLSCDWEGIIYAGCGWDLNLEELKIGWSNNCNENSDLISQLGKHELDNLVTEHENYVLRIIKAEIQRASIQDRKSLVNLIFSRYFQVTSSEKFVPINTKRAFIIGPSHLCVGKVFLSNYPNCFSLNNSPIIRFDHLDFSSAPMAIPNTIDVLGFAGMPVFNLLTFDLIEKAHHSMACNVVWMVPDFRINNIEVDVLREKYRRFTGYVADSREPEMLLFSNSRFGTIDKSLLNAENDSFLVDYSLRIIDYIVSRFPTIKLLFWCAYKRFANCSIRSLAENSSFPEYSKRLTSIYSELYPVLVSRYPRNVIDIRTRCPSLEKFNNTMTFDSGGHPTKKGYALIGQLIQDLE